MGSQSRLIKFEQIKSKESKGLNIYTGLCYHLSVKSIPNGIVTFEVEPREHEGNLVQLALNNIEEFEDEGPLALRALWTILPVDANMYQLRVLSNPEGNLSYTHCASWGGRYVEVDFNSPENYQKGATMYYSSLWYFRSCECPDHYEVHNADPRRDPNFVTFSNEPSELGQLMQLGTKDNELYEPKGVFRQDALWTFRPQKYKISVFITDFKFEDLTDSEVSDAAFPILFTEEIIEKSDKEVYRIDNMTTLPEDFKLSFMQSFKPFQAENIQIDPKCFDGSSQLKFLEAKPAMLFKRKEGSNTQFICSPDVSYRVNEDFKFPDGANKLKVKAFCSVVQDLDIPFTAMAHCSATADVCTNFENEGFQHKLTQIDSNEIVEYLLKYEKFSGKVVNNNVTNTRPTSSFNKKPAGESSRENTVKSDKAVVKCQVSGRLKCNCGVSTFIDVQMLE